jgi:hypothetical protein
MAESSLKSPGTMANSNDGGTYAWTNVDNAKASDDTYAVATAGAPGTTQRLQASNFGFEIPAGATIDGIKVEIERNRLSSSGAVTDDEVKLILADGSLGDTNKAIGTLWNTTTDTYYTYGGDDDLWGEDWEAEDINDSDFGVNLKVDCGIAQIGQRDPSVDHIRITVYYTEGAPPVVGGGGFDEMLYVY